jgi:predicted amidophosphoribosyltransferase
MEILSPRYTDKSNILQNLSEPANLTLVWQCCLRGNEIEVSFGTKQYGSYSLLTEPYCEICAFPGVITTECSWHSDDYGFERIYAMGKYISSRTAEGWNDLLSKHIRGLKRYPSYSEPLGKAMSLCVRKRYTELAESDCLVPVPKHPDEMTNGYNQAQKLTEVVSGILGLPIRNSLAKLKATKMKRFSSRVSRKAGVKGLYALTGDSTLRGRDVVLIDDVTTSGSTASECGQTLLNAGAKTVNVLVAGRDVFVD